MAADRGETGHPDRESSGACEEKHPVKLLQFAAWSYRQRHGLAVSVVHYRHQDISPHGLVPVVGAELVLTGVARAVVRPYPGKFGGVAGEVSRRRSTLAPRTAP
jgi:hypothetical protein